MCLARSKFGGDSDDAVAGAVGMAGLCGAGPKPQYGISEMPETDKHGIGCVSGARCMDIRERNDDDH